MIDDLPIEARELVELLDLHPHPEGGFYRETHRSPVTIPGAALPGHPADRCAVTSILFLLPAGARSKWHRVRSEELWLHHQGDPLQLRFSGGRPSSEAITCDRILTLGQGPPHILQAVVPAGHWQDAEAIRGPYGYALVGCVVAPGFDFDDFEMLNES